MMAVEVIGQGLSEKWVEVKIPILRMKSQVQIENLFVLNL